MKDLIKKLGFTLKNNAIDVYNKTYTNNKNYTLEVDFIKNTIDFGSKIFFNDSNKNIQNIVKPEDLVVLECVDRLLEKGYRPQNIILEKSWRSGHGTSGRVDIFVTNEDNTAYMMIECKTWGKEFDKEFANLNKNGGQLFTYFQQDTNVKLLVLYTSSLISNKIEYKNEIIKIEEEYRTTSNVKDFYDRWNKTTKNNGIFNDWNRPYNYKSQALIPKNLIDIKQEDSSFIFNRFMEILRHNVVSDKPNAFNKIFTLFLCKIMDEKSTKPNEELEFQWLEGIDNHVAFQKRLTDLYQRGMKEFLDKEVTDLSDKEFEERFGTRLDSFDNKIKEQLLEEFTKIRLEKNNEFAIKDVFDAETFEENAVVVKEIVELLQDYKIRYTKKQQFLSDFFELLLTTGLKQEVGQFFTPVPITKFIIKSIPFDKIIKEKLSKGEKDELLPNVIDYAVGSGHFITEAMDEIQKEINNISPDDFISDTARKLKSWKEDHFNWAYDYVYGIEKDYRLVKTAKVGCYLHGDGLAKVIHGDGLSNFSKTKEYTGKLKHSDKNYPQDNKKFDIVVSNPPYSVSAFKNISKKFNSNDFELYDKLTDQSSEIEALFIERTKQLLKDGGIAGIILPSSILTGGGIYTKTREVIFKYFDIVSVTELGSNTFMATGTNTVVLFLRRKNNMEHVNIIASVEKLFSQNKDITINGIENPLSKYIGQVWEGINFKDYVTLLEKNPNENVLSNELYKEYDKKFNDIEKIIELEKEKLSYFILAYKQKVTLVKTGEKKEEKKFLGYEFSNRRGSEGIHPIQRSKSIDECTSLYDSSSYTNELKVNSYIYSAFEGEFNPIDKSLEDNVSYIDLVDMISFDRVDFDKSISVNSKKKVKIESKWDLADIGSLICEESKSKIKVNTVKDSKNGKYNFFTSGEKVFTYSEYLVDGENIYLSTGGNAIVKYYEGQASYSTDTYVINSNNSKIKTKYIFYILESLIDIINTNYFKGVGLKHLQKTDFRKIKIPLPPKEVQQQIIDDIEVLETKTNQLVQEIDLLKFKIEKMFINSISDVNTTVKLSDTDIFDISIGKRVLRADVHTNGNIPVYSANVFEPFGYIEKHLLTNYDVPSVLWGIDGDWMVNYYPKDQAFYPTDHCGVLRVKNNKINERLLVYILNQEGINLRFSRTKRASIDRIKNIKIPLPSMKQQEEIISQIEIIEDKIQKKEKELQSIPSKKEEILNKYLK